MSIKNDFFRQFRFGPEHALNIGIEREMFLVGPDGFFVPAAERVLECLSDRKRFGYELSACQLENRVGPCSVVELPELLAENDREIRSVISGLGLGLSFSEVSSPDMPLDIYPDPEGRYPEIAEKLRNDDRLGPACRIIGTHVHIGMPDLKTAIQVHDGVYSEWERLVRLGDHSDGERMRLYGLVAPEYAPKPYGSVDGFYGAAIAEGFAENPRDCWRIIRISRHGTIEFRMFGVTDDLTEVVGWAEECLRLCRSFAR